MIIKKEKKQTKSNTNHIKNDIVMSVAKDILKKHKKAFIKLSKN